MKTSENAQISKTHTQSVAPTPWSTRTRAIHFYKWLGTGSTV